MENKLTELYGLQVTARLRFLLADAAKWGQIAAFVGLISSAVSMLTGFTRGNVIGVLVTVALNVLLYIYLLQFSKKMKIALQNNDQGEFVESLRSLQTYFKIMGILLIVVMVIAVLVIAFVSVIGVNALRR
ncbi:DUF5362 family protein [Deminuibacter soli]|uniref:Uncharacterized protein n=1 Tax=Deminuibacter soli TaxID=2291815 RepID=A0A3E1NM14_9BACT|nr:DUF5362 family protein [Deminuibacter soli]RFM28962.1 hypothetical protein DXN05_09365 [Deminuibacter soli]